jgi:hypothetical protein
VNDARAVHIFETSKNLVKEILDELLLERSRSKKSMKVGSEKFCDEINIFQGRNKHIRKCNDLEKGGVRICGSRHGCD